MAFLIFLRCQHHDQLPTFHFRELFDRAIFTQVFFNALQQPDAQFLMGHFPPTETQRHFGFVAVGQKTDQVSQFDLIIPFFRPRTEFDFLDMDLFLFLLRRMPLFVLLEQKLAVIHDTAYWRICLRGDLYQIHIRISGILLGFRVADNAYLFPIGADQSDFGSSDLLVQPRCRLILFSSDTLFLQFNLSFVRDVILHALHERLDRHDPQIATLTGTHRHRLVGQLTISCNNQIGDTI